MSDQITALYEAIARIEADAALLRQMVQGDETTTVETEGGLVDSVAKVIADMEAAINAAGEGWLAEAIAVSAESLKHQGDWDASGGTFPADPELGHFYRISVAGELSGVQMRVGDHIVYNGAAWEHIGNAVRTVFGRTGDVESEAGDYSAAQVSYDPGVSGLMAGLVQAAIDEIVALIADHVSDQENPHAVTAADVGLDAVPNEDATDMANWDQKGATEGQVPTWNGAEYVPADVAGAGGGGAIQDLGATAIGVVDPDIASHFRMEEAPPALAPLNLVHAVHDGTGFVAAAGDGTMIRSVDAGITWAPGGAGPQTTRRLRSDGVAAYALEQGNHMWRSADTGATWTDLGAPSGIEVGHNLHDVVHDGSQWIASANNADFIAFAYTSPDGVTWTKRGDGNVGILGSGVFHVTKIAYDDVAGAAIVAGDVGAVARSTDGGVTWTLAASTATTADPQEIVSVGGVTVLTSIDGEIAVSTDGGATWSNPSIHGVYLPFGVAGGGDGIYLSGATMSEGIFSTLKTSDGATWIHAGGSGVPWNYGCAGAGASESLLVGNNTLVAHKTAQTGGFAMRHMTWPIVDVKQPSEELAHRISVLVLAPGAQIALPWFRDGEITYLADIEPAGGAVKQAIRADYMGGGAWTWWIHPVASSQV